MRQKISSLADIILLVIGRLGIVSNTALGLPLWWFWHNFPDGIKFVATILTGVFIGGLVLLFRKDELRFNADDSTKPAAFIKVDKGRTAVIEMGGRPIKVIYGGELPPFTLSWLGLWWLYQAISFWTIGLYPYIPYFTRPKSYPLPRYRKQEKDGRNEYVAVKVDDPGYNSDHVRNALTSFPKRYRGVDVQKIPFEVDLSVQYYIGRGKEIGALYGIEQWNVLLDQALGSILRGTMRSNVTVDEILGEVPQKIWEKKRTSTSKTVATKVADLIKTGLDNYSVEVEITSRHWLFWKKTERVQRKLADLGIVVSRVDITDFRDELPAEQRDKLLAAVLGREAGRAADLKGQGFAKAQKDLKDVHGDGTGASTAIIEANALIEAAKSQGGAVDAIAAAAARHLMKGSTR